MAGGGHDPGVADGSEQDHYGPDGRYKLSGHGNYYAEDGVITVPEGTWLTVYAEHGSQISTALGNLIESGGDTSRVFSRTFQPGDEMPNYTLLPPDDLTIVGTPHTVATPTTLENLLRPHMGIVDFAACLGHWGDKHYDVGGVFDSRTLEPIETYPPKAVYEDDDW